MPDLPIKNLAFMIRIVLRYSIPCHELMASSHQLF